MVKPTIKLLADRVLIKVDAPKEKTESGLFIPESGKEVPVFGEVIAVGPGKKDWKMTAKEGDRVRFAKHSGTEVELEGDKYLIIREEDIFLIL